MELFRDSDDDSEEDRQSDQLRINQSYASHYEEYRAAEELQRLKAKYGDVPLTLANGEEEEQEGSSSSESESDEAVEDDFDFFKALSALKSKDPKIYDGETYFFGGSADDSDDDDEDYDREGGDGEPSTVAKEKTGRKIVAFPPSPKREMLKEDDVKPMFLKDYERETILAGGQFDEDEVDDDDDGGGEDDELRRPSSPTYVEEQRKIQQSFKTALADDDDGDGDGTTNSLLKKKIKTQEEKEKEEKDFREWLMTNDGDAEATGEETEMRDLSGLKNYWNQSNLEESEKFLKDFLLSKRYLVGDKNDYGEEDDDCEEGDGEGGRMVSSEEEEEEMDRLDDFESQFNFRFQEPDADVIKSYPRTIQETVRKEARSRKEKRDAREERKKEEKQKVIEELNLLKNLKQKEILSKVEQLKKIAGKEDGKGADQMDEEYFDKDFDPAEHDAMVEKMFDTDYYEGEGAAQDEKLPGPPPLPTDGISADVLDELALDDENWDEWDGNGDGGGDDDEEGAAVTDAISGFLQSERASRTTSRKEKRQRQREKKKSLFKKAVEKEKPVFDPGEKTFDEYIEEYYKLNFEDVIGKTPVRFKYRPVQANSFGLTTEEILSARDKELNQWASIKKASQYRTEEEELYDLKAFQAKAKNEFKKKQVLKSLFEEKDGEEAAKEEEEGDNDGEIVESAESSTSETKTMTASTATTTAASSVEKVVVAAAATSKISKKKKKKKKVTVSPESVPAAPSTRVPPAQSSNPAPALASTLSSSVPISSAPESLTNSVVVSRKKKKKKRKNDSSLDVSADLPAEKRMKSSGVTESLENDEAESRREEADGEKAEKRGENLVEINASERIDSQDITRKKKRRRNKKIKKNEGGEGTKNRGVGENESDGKSKTIISDSRLLAYDINPKKFQRFQKYGKKKSVDD